MCKGIPIKTNIRERQMAYPDNYFDIIYNKSLLEHMWNPDKFLNEAKEF